MTFLGITRLRKSLRCSTPEKLDIYNVRGNCDTEVDQMVLEFPVLTEYMLIPILGAGAPPVIFATHGHIYNENNLPPFHKGDILLHGHTHVPACTDRGDYIYMNPGSLSIPKEDSSERIHDTGALPPGRLPFCLERPGR